MASIEFIEKRIEGKEKEVAALEKKLERIRKVESQGWADPNPYYYTQSDLRICIKDLENSQAALNKYKHDLEVAQQKSASRDVPAITEFLDKWEQRAIEYYIAQYDLYLQAKHEWADYQVEHCNKFNSGYYRNNKELYQRENKEYHDKQRQFIERWRHVTQFDHGSLSWEETMKKDIRQERNRKYDWIIERTNAIVGQITDATHLSVGEKGDLNGYIIGTNGKAHVQTIGAGGYNEDVIVNVKHGQIFHFRTLINPMN